MAGPMVPGNGLTQRVQDLERRVDHLEIHGSRPVALVQRDFEHIKEQLNQVRLEVAQLKTEVNKDGQAMRADIRAVGSRVSNRLMTFAFAIAVAAVIFALSFRGFG